MRSKKTNKASAEVPLEIRFKADISVHLNENTVLSPRDIETVRLLGAEDGSNSGHWEIDTSEPERKATLEKLLPSVGAGVIDGDVPKEGRASIREKAEAICQEYDTRAEAVDKILRYGRKPSLTVDGVILRKDRFLAIKRGRNPFRNKFALPGGFTEYGESVEEAIVREVKEETSLKTRVVELIGVYSSPNRDPRGHVVSCAFILKVLGGELKAGDDAADARWLSSKDPGELAFDHNKILIDALERMEKE